MPTPESRPQLPSTAASAAAKRFVCVHGHFYQPPRENPWLETVEMQNSAAPYHDWNDRITAECYAPNGASRIQNVSKQIVRIVNNYGRMSFNFGPTLLSWLHLKAPRTYQMILAAEQASAARFGGHGSAMAQVYNHIIMPLANERDARTQIRWGIADFRLRFGRKPEGMWLAETACSRAVLDLLAQEGIRFTVLAPNQCARVRPSAAPGEAGADWTPTPNDSVDPSQPYRVCLDEGREIAVFFYHGPNSRAIAFEGLLDSGEKFASRLLSAFPAEADRPMLSHVATDGESYGHHHKHGEMALSFSMHWLEEQGRATLTNYGEFLERFPPAFDAEIVEDSSWSCSHGVERWRSDCGCNGGKPGWNQRWRGPLRAALDLLRDRTAPLAEQLAAGLLRDVWAARDAYIDVVLQREMPGAEAAAVDRFFAAQAVRELTASERSTVLELMELERHTQLMYTSCGWFFDEISGIETVQIIAYAGRVLQLAAKLFDGPGFAGKGRALEPAFLAVLAEAKPNVPDLKDGAEVYRRYVAGMRVGLEQVAAHYAISSTFRNYPERGELFCFDVHRGRYEVFTSGRGRVAVGHARIRSKITEEAQEFCFAVLHLGDQNLSAAVRPFDPETDERTFAGLTAELRTAMRRADLPEVIRLIDRYFGARARRVPMPTAHLALDPAAPEPAAPDQAGMEQAALNPEASQRAPKGSAEGGPAPGAAQPGTDRTVDDAGAVGAAGTGMPERRAESRSMAYSLNSLFADEQHRILEKILNQTIGEMEDSLRKIYEDHASLLQFLTESGMTPPPALALAANFATNASLKHAIEAEPFDAGELADLLGRAAADGVHLDTALLSFAAGQRMKREMVRLEAASEGEPRAAEAALHEALTLAEMLRFMPFEVGIWQAQNIWHDLLRRTDSNYRSVSWREGFRKLGEAMNLAVGELVVEDGVPAF